MCEETRCEETKPPRASDYCPEGCRFHFVYLLFMCMLLMQMEFSPASRFRAASARRRRRA